MRKIAEFPLLFSGTRATRCASPAPLPGTRRPGRMWYFRLAIAQVPGKRETALVLDRVIPDVDALDMPNFQRGRAFRWLADDVKALKISYLGRDKGSSLDVAARPGAATGTTRSCCRS